jgi:hypothetical protein
MAAVILRVIARSKENVGNPEREMGLSLVPEIFPRDLTPDDC